MSSPSAQPARRTQAERTAESASRLREALAALIAEQGYERTTAAQIGERAGYSRAMVRERFGSKDALLQSLHAEYEASILSDDHPDDETGLGRALHGVDRLHVFATEHPTLLRAIFVVSFESVGAAQDARPTVVRWLDVLVAQSRSWLIAGMADGSVRRDLDADAESDRWLTEAIGGGFRWVLAPDDVDYPAHLLAWRAALRARYAA
ncbi:TetR/AcrR family transcriptional regulator [Patulibacter minatonensis]|uniref:TetR/AcrR family transcriptional regulator n=1 Tax=Patulibacter minatonensis TaxID=298163 RepID=UPI0004BCB86A|nr:TetR/AcrR family transcriptional regulator [Patulibacter minatonensis]